MRDMIRFIWIDLVELLYLSPSQIPIKYGGADHTLDDGRDESRDMLDFGMTRCRNSGGYVAYDLVSIMRGGDRIRRVRILIVLTMLSRKVPESRGVTIVPVPSVDWWKSKSYVQWKRVEPGR